MSPAPELHALGGGEAPLELAGDLLCMQRFPQAALAKVWQVLGPCLAETIGAETSKLLDTFCATHGIASDDLGRAIKSSRFLIQSAARRDIPKDRLAEDLARLCDGAPLVSEVLLAGYDQARVHLQKNAAVAALLAHGKLLTGAEWRLDTVEGSDRGGRFRAPVTMLTLSFRDGQESGRVTVQVLPDMLAQLETICAEARAAGRVRG